MLMPDALGTLSAALDKQPVAGMAFGVVEPFGADAKVIEHHRQY
jgi:hypothetical protein